MVKIRASKKKRDAKNACKSQSEKVQNHIVWPQFCTPLPTRVHVTSKTHQILSVVTWHRVFFLVLYFQNYMHIICIIFRKAINVIRKIRVFFYSRYPYACFAIHLASKGLVSKPAPLSELGCTHGSILCGLLQKLKLFFWSCGWGLRKQVNFRPDSSSWFKKCIPMRNSADEAGVCRDKYKEMKTQ